MQWVIAGFEGEVEAETKQVPMAKWRGCKLCTFS